ncbi:MAG: right-handed parallel beta-helix repeat-containing protein [Planctomycetota bacterium]
MATVLALGAWMLTFTTIGVAQEQLPFDDAIEALKPAGQVVRWQQPAPHEPIVLHNQTGITFRSLKIEGDISITLENCKDITIISCDLRSIRASGVDNLRIYNSHLHDSENNAVSLDGCHDVVIQGNLIENVATGVYAHQSTAVQVVGNLCFDVQGPFPRGQLVQFDKVTGLDNLIMGNIAANRHGQSNPEDMVNLYQSVGTAESPIRVELNYLAGDPDVGSEDKSESGSGIMLGDGGGQHQVCFNNTLINPGQVGIGVAGGGDIQVLNNTIVGGRSNVANVGLYTWHQYAEANVGPVLVADNRVQWINAKGLSNPYWNGDGFTKVTRQNNTFGNTDLTTDGFPTVTELTMPPVPHGKEPYYPFPID